MGKKNIAKLNKQNKFINILLSYFKWYDYLFFTAVIIFFWFSFFFRADIWHTGNCSLAYNAGHILDFYDYNAPVFLRLDYYPLIYIIFAIWNIPLSLFGMTSFEQINTAIMLYEKILPILFLIGSTFPIYHISRKIGLNEKISVYSALLYLTTPFTFVTIIGWGLYDSLYIFFLLFGLYFFIKEKKKSDNIIAMLLFGLAFSIKFIAAIVVIPMIAYKYKNVFKLTGCYFLSIIPLTLQILFYNNSVNFMSSSSNGSVFSDRLTALTFGVGTLQISVFFTLWIILCCFAYFVPYTQKDHVKIFYIGMVAAIIFLCCIEWHPQWFTLLAPFLVLTTISHNERNRLYVFDIIFSCSFFMMVWNRFMFFGQEAIKNGGFGNLFVSHAGYFIPNSIFSSSDLLLLSSIFTGVMIFYVIAKNPWRAQSQFHNPGEIEIDKKDKIYLYARYLLPLIFYIVPIAYWAMF